MKRITTLLAALTLSVFSFAQTVENIRVDTQGDEIRITYRIGGSTEAQFYDVTLSCSMDGGARFEPKSVMGDVGPNIVGGKSIYTIMWDVFEDVEQVGNAEFFVKVDLIRDLDEVTSPVPVSAEQQRREVDPSSLLAESNPEGSTKPTFDRRVFIAYNGSLASPYGISVGLIKNWGFYGSFRFGGYSDDWESDVWFTAAAGATKFIVGNDKYRLHGYAGLGATFEVFEEYFFYTSWTDTYFTVDAGLTGVIRFLNLTLGMEYLSYYGAELVFGIGFVF
jgi:hypothetical protein